MPNISSSPAYIPGVCNINHAEIAYRRKASYVGLALFVIVAIVLFALDINRWARLILFVPAFIAAIGFLQAKNKFCVSYAASGQQNATDGSKSASTVSDAAAHGKDKARAQAMNTQAALAAVVATAIALIF